MENCPKCRAALELDEDELDEGDVLTCEECGVTISVTGTHPLELEAEEEEDDDDDLDDFDDDEDDEEEEDWK